MVILLPGKSHVQRSLVGYSPRGHKESDSTERLYLLMKPRWASLAAQLAKNKPAKQETSVQFLNQEDPLEKGQAPHSSILGLPCWLRW